MRKEEIISGLKFTIDMFLFDPTTGEEYAEPRNDMDKTTIDACRGAIELLEQEPILDKIRAEIIENSIKDYEYHGCGTDELIIETNEVLRIIDKYKAESEDKI